MPAPPAPPRASPPALARLRTLLALLLLTLLPLPLRAADKPEYALAADIGWQGLLIPERWCPVTLRLSAPGGLPLAEALDATLSIAYVQDASQQTVIRQRFATTPGQVAEIRAAICVPRHLQRIDITLAGPDGRPLARAVYTHTPDIDRNERLLPTVYGIDTFACLRVGSPDSIGTGLPKDVFSHLRAPQSFSSSPRVVCLAMPAPRLPQSAAAFDSLNLIVVSADLQPDPRSVSAVREWVLAGGRLVIISDRPGDAWRQWLPSGPAGDLVELAPLAEHVLPQAALDALVEPPPKVISPPFPGAPATTPVVPADSAPSAPPAAASSIRARLLSLTPAAAREGWRLRWLVQSEPRPAGLIAEGPVGFGHVMILAVEPRACTASRKEDDAAGLWHDALAYLLADEHRPEIQHARYWNDDGQTASGDSPESRSAIEHILNLIADVAPIDNLVFLSVLASMLLLCLLIGPVDFFLLRKPALRHRSWMTALLWVALSSLIAYAVPQLLRGSASRAQRVSAIDILQPPDPVALAPSLAFHASLTQIWSGLAQRLTPLAPFASSPSDSAPTPLALAPSDGSRWRGVSSLPLSRWADTIARPTNRFTQRAPSIDNASDSWGGLPARQDAATQPAPESGLNLERWTLRAVLDAGRAAPPIFAALSPPRGVADARTLRLNLPPGARIQSSALRIADAWYLTSFRAASDSASPDRPQDLTAEIGASFIPKADFAFSGPPIQTATDENDQWPPPVQAMAPPPTLKTLPGIALQLPGVARRDLAIQNRLASGAFAALYLHLTDLPSDLRWSAPIDASRQAVVRLLIPLDPSDAPSPSPPSPSGSP